MGTGLRETAEVLLLDLDGVLRVFDPSVAAGAERRHGLPEGALSGAAFAWSRLRPAIVGECRHAEWMEQVAADLAETIGSPERAAAAVAEWHAYRGEVVPAVLDFVRGTRSAGVTVGLATNATSLLDEDLEALGLRDEVDIVVNSSVLGVHKPTREFFVQACAAVDRAPARVLFVDDEDRNVRGARVAGLSAYRWSGISDAPYLRAALGL